MQRKIFIIFTIILLLGILMTSFLYLSLIRSSHLDELENKLISNGKLIEAIIHEREVPLNKEEYQRIATTYGEKIGSRITLIDGKGVVLADTLARLDGIKNHYNRPEIQAAYKGEVGRATRYSATINEEMFYIAIPVDIQPHNIKVIRLSVNLQQIKDLNRRLYYYVGISMLLGFLATLLLASRFIRKLMEPIHEMTEISQKIADGDLNRRVYVVSNDEMGILANNFNHMADKMKEMIDKLLESNTKFSGLLASIINPIIAVDNKHKIIFLNPAAEELFQISADEATGKHLLEIVRNNQLDEKIKDVFENHRETQLEISIDEPTEKILKIYTNLIRLENDPTRTMGIVALIQDVTEIRKLEKMRSDFVANVSHELKTPLTSISGFVETLKSGAIEDETTRERFLDIIDIETGRLTRLIDDILTLSEIENTNIRSYKQEIHPSEVIGEVLEILTPIATSKDISLTGDIEANLPPIKGNRDWFKQMLINLLDNSIKYTPVGGKVTLNAFKKYHNTIISIKDTGTGIAKSEIPRLFERFYRVDKARSKRIAGTGLGLAIVKHIVLSLKGKIKVNSELGKGTEFTIILPIEKSN
ncbi:two-component system histidine kinase PnpS [Alkaliphilus serpentinus]|uniref:histidine kinase n=1 Tax=Alkaliphilus serpentinus TaxID=1482731 RepID=A0A833MBE7_9FIRM|nr:ATP-binding protein [Alkaliphilus serpentinus]KAB3533172.1 HAMP domain-containing protein [Alkaliphilus serpentinus]